MVLANSVSRLRLQRGRSRRRFRPTATRCERKNDSISDSYHPQVRERCGCPERVHCALVSSESRSDAVEARATRRNSSILYPIRRIRTGICHRAVIGSIPSPDHDWPSMSSSENLVACPEPASHFTDPRTWIAQDPRHSYASRALALGESLTMIGTLLGHTRVQRTARYVHLARVRSRRLLLGSPGAPAETWTPQTSASHMTQSSDQTVTNRLAARHVKDWAHPRTSLRSSTS